MSSALTLTLSVPSKTFLLGEYLALGGGPSIILNTAPRFELNVTNLNPGRGETTTPFAPGSPAGRLLARLAGEHSINLNEVAFQFHDPHRGAGGLGASSAQFALLYARSQSQQGLVPDLVWPEILAVYRECAWNGEGQAPSGADVVAQLTGGVCWFDGQNHVAERLSWGFASLSFTLVRTGFKLATHEHLMQVPAPRYQGLRECVALGKAAILDRRAQPLIEAVAQAGVLLDQAGLVAEATRGLLAEIKAYLPRVLAAKGCGAMGADVILLLHERSEQAAIRSWVEHRGLSICGREQELEMEGLKIQ